MTRLAKSKAPPKPAEIRRARESVGLTQTAAAHVALSSLRAWQYWEAGKTRMHPAIWQYWLTQVERTP